MRRDKIFICMQKNVSLWYKILLRLKKCSFLFQCSDDSTDLIFQRTAIHHVGKKWTLRSKWFPCQLWRHSWIIHWLLFPINGWNCLFPLFEIDVQRKKVRKKILVSIQSTVGWWKIKTVKDMYLSRASVSGKSNYLIHASFPV